MKLQTVITDITHDDLVNLISRSATGSCWLGVDYDSKDYKSLPNKSDDDYIEDIMAKILLAGKSVRFFDTYAEDKDDFYGTLPHMYDGKYMFYTVNLEDIKKGLVKASNGSWPRECLFALMEDDGFNLDLPRAECLMQHILFGEEIYG